MYLILCLHPLNKFEDFRTIFFLLWKYVILVLGACPMCHMLGKGISNPGKLGPDLEIENRNNILGEGGLGYETCTQFQLYF